MGQMKLNLQKKYEGVGEKKFVIKARVKPFEMTRMGQTQSKRARHDPWTEPRSSYGSCFRSCSWPSSMLHPAHKSPGPPT